MYLSAGGAQSDIEKHVAALAALAVIWVAAKVFAEVFERLRQPAVVGEILAGVLIGPAVLGWVTPTDFTSMLAEIGVVFLIFTVGLETKPHDIFRVGGKAVLVAVSGVIVPLALGCLLMRVWGAQSVESLFVGTAMVATSVGITARVLEKAGLLESEVSRIILGAAIIDDILGLLVLAFVSSLARGEADYVELLLTVIVAVAFVLFAVFVAGPAVRRIAPAIENLQVANSFFVFALALCLVLSAAAAYIGIAAIIGAFFAGMALAEPSEEHPTMRKQMNGVAEFLIPFFLAGVGMQLKLDAFREPNLLVLTLLITVLAILSKLAGGAAPLVSSMGWRRAAQVGMGMVPRGEVGVVVAQIGLGLAVISDALYGSVLFMAIATTLIAPPILNLLFREPKGKPS